jgi:protein gp37
MTKIQWTNETWNPIVGCSKISEGCQNCYAQAAAQSPRLQQFEQYQAVKNWDGTTYFAASQLKKPLLWKKTKRIFVCSMSDLFHPNNKEQWLVEIFKVFQQCPQHQFQLLTKRPQAMLDWFATHPYPMTNLWLGTTIENQNNQFRIDILKLIPYQGIKFLSCEPLLGNLMLGNLTGIDWVIVGGESGHKSRLCKSIWIENILNQCAAHNVPCFVKQLGTHHLHQGAEIKVPGSLGGGKIEFFPTKLQVQNFPSYFNP